MSRDLITCAFQTKSEAIRSVRTATDESGQPAYVKFDDSISPKLVEEQVW